MITAQQQKQIEQWVCSQQYKKIEPQIVDGCVEFLTYNPQCEWQTAFKEVCCEIITNKQINFTICSSIWPWVAVEICHKYGEDYYPKMIQNRQRELAKNTDF